MLDAILYTRMITNLALVAVGAAFLVLGFGLIVTRVKANFRLWLKGAMGEAGLSSVSPGLLFVAVSAILFALAAGMHFDMSEATTSERTTVTAHAPPGPPAAATTAPPQAGPPAAPPAQPPPSATPPSRPAAGADDAGIEAQQVIIRSERNVHYAGGPPLTVAHVVEAIDAALAALNEEQESAQGSNDTYGIQRRRLAIQRLTELREGLARGPHRH